MPQLQCLSLARHPGNLPDAFLLAFDANESEVARFNLHGIACPSSVARSVPKRRAEYLAGRRAAMAALADAGADLVDLAIGPSRAPVWPAGFIGSITHAAGIAAAVALRDGALRGVGIDLERIATAGALDAIARSVVDAAERSVLDELARRFGEPMALTVAFSAKESFYKATAATVGRVFDFSALKLVNLNEEMIVAETPEPLAAALPKGMRFELGYSLLDETTVITSCAWKR
ncbi:4'-phosphopantetheinyl transferase family protein [Dyella sp. 2RAB6]|uniref:4'-phosphopantetheinyl transferase family protein n=1 Tax=Dyella sp. 2RAB6 TaxID=3232992 RepID=UPI003F938EEF